MMLRASWLRPGRLFNRRTARALLWTVVVLTAAVGANIAGIYLAGSVAGWQQWLAASASYFFIWRVCVYGLTAWGWLWMRRRLLARDADAQASRRLMRSEIAGVTAIAALEASLLLG